MNISSACNHSKRSRRSYHTSIKILAQTDGLSKHILNQIPKSNISKWKKEDFSRHFGSDQLHFLDDYSLVCEELSKHKKFTKSCAELLRVKNAVIDVLTIKLKKKAKDIKREIKEIIIHTTERVKDTFSLNRIMKYFKITIHQYYVWLHQIKYSCLQTVTEFCPRFHPNQLSKKEIKIIKKHLNNPKYKGDSIYAIAWHCIRKGILYVSVSTWYKYARLLGFTRRLPKNRKRNLIGIRAEKVMEIIHADVTIFRPLDHSRVYIYIIMDNKSRYIFNWRASLEYSGKICTENLKQTYNKYLHPFYQGEQTKLIVDGGVENNNTDVDQFLDDVQGSLQKLIAQKDIIFSNSMVESVNKILKYRHLFQHDIPDFESTVKHLKKAIPKYNNRPHGSLNGHTPHEILKGIELNQDKIKKGFQDAYKRRILDNRKIRCKNCEDR